MCVCVCVCVCACLRACVRVCAYMHACVRTYVMDKHKLECMFESTHLWMYMQDFIIPTEHAGFKSTILYHILGEIFCDVRKDYLNTTTIMHADCTYCLVGLVVKASASIQKIPGSNPVCTGIFPGSSHTNDLKIGTPVASLPGA